MHCNVNICITWVIDLINRYLIEHSFAIIFHNISLADTTRGHSW